MGPTRFHAQKIIATEFSQKSLEYCPFEYVISNVKSHTTSFRFPAIALLIACIASSVSCMTTYDTYGRPVQSVDPALAVAGVAAAGILGYAVANNNSNNGYYRGGGCYGGGYYYRSYRPCY